MVGIIPSTLSRASVLRHKACGASIIGCLELRISVRGGMHNCSPGNEPIHISDETVHLHRVKLSPVNSPSAPTNRMI